MATKSTPKNEKNETKQTASMTSTLTWLPKKTFELEITIPQNQVKETYDKVLNKATASITLKGFRQGKAPKQLVEKEIGKEKLYEDVVQDLVSEAYFQAIQQHQLHPIVDPEVTPVSLKENEDWILKAKACEVPDVKLNNYKDAIKGIRAKKSIWTPDKGSAKPDAPEKAEDHKPTTEEIYDELLKITEVELPEILLESETNRLLSNMVDQVLAAGLSIQQYLESRHKSQDQLRAEYQDTAEKSLKIEFVITKIAEEEKITADTKEVEAMVEKANDPYAKKALENPQQKLYMSILLKKQKTIDFLKSL